MDDLISRQAAIDEIQRFIGYLDQDMIDRLKIAIGRLPSAEPDKGHWKPRKHYVSPLHEAFVEDYECSNCHFQDGELEWNYCPICGAKMRGENNG